MCVKWKGIYSQVKQLPGGEPQGGKFGFLELLAQSNDNSNMVKPEDRYKFVDDLTALEIINLLCIQVTSYDLYSHIPQWVHKK